jgi:indolepyruvate ferredoxin oxidoreductase
VTGDGVGDLVVAAGFEARSKMMTGGTHAIVNSHEAITGEFTRKPDLDLQTQRLQELIRHAAGDDKAEFLDATRIATALMGDSIATNLFMLGYAWQRGLVPLSEEAILRAIELNGVAVEANKRSFEWGRRAAADLAAVERAAAPKAESTSHHLSQTLEELVDRRVAFLTDYQDAAYAGRYKALVDQVKAVEAELAPGMSGLAAAVARYYFKLLAYKDEYEVARLFTDGEFMARVREQFEGDYKLRFHLAPPLFSERDPNTGRLKKREYGPWAFHAFKLLARLKRLRGTRLDVFGYTADRKRERQLIKDYEVLIDELLAGLQHDNHALAVELASIPEHIRGYGHVKEAHLDRAKNRESELLAAFRNPAPTRTAAE